MANQITVNSGTGNITVTTSRAVIGTVANVASANIAYALDADIANVSISGGTNGYVLQTDGAGTLTWTAQTGGGGNGTVAGSNTQVQFNDAGAFGADANLVFDKVTGVLTASKVAGNGAQLTAITGANVTGIVANATFATSAGTANSATVAASANSVAGANVTGTVANATYADNAGNANTANSATVAASANSVAVANVTGIGNIATVNLDGNASNVLRGDGTFSAEAGNLNANFANFAGNITVSSQPNITSTGNLTSFQVGTGSDDTLRFTPSGSNLTLSTGNVLVAQNRITTATAPIDAVVLPSNGISTYTQQLFTPDGSNVATFGSIIYSTDAALGAGNAAQPASITQRVYTTDSQLANANPNSTTDVIIGTSTSATALFINQKMPTAQNAPVGVIGLLSYGHASDPSTATAMYIQRRRGNNSGGTGTRDEVQANDYLGNIVWRGAGATNGTVNSGPVSIGARVDSSYGGPGNVMPIGMQMTVVNSSNTQLSHNFYANGNTAFAGAISATNIGNIANINLDGSSSNVLYGNGVWAAAGGGGDANFANYAGNVTVSSQGNITSLGNLVSLQIGNSVANTATTTFTPVGANITTLSGDIFVNNKRVSYDDADVLANGISTQDAIINPYDTANGSSQSYQLNYLIQDLANTANIAIAGTDTITTFLYDAGNAASPTDRTISVYTRDSQLANANPSSALNFVFGGSGLFLNRQMPNDVAAQDQTGMINMINYGELSDPASATGLSFQRRRGDNSGGSGTRLPVQSNDYLGNISWRGAGSNTGTINSSRAIIGAKVDGSYGGPGNVMPIGMEMVVVDSSNAQLTHSFYANGDVSFAGNILSNVPASTQIVNGNSSVSFTGAGGDLNINIDGTQYAKFYNNRRFELTGVEADSGNATQLVLDNGGIQLVQEDLGGGFASFDFKSYFSTSFIAPYTFYRARGNTASPNNVQSGDAVKSESYIVYGDSGNTFVNIGGYSATVTANDNAGNVQSRIEIATNRNDNGSEVKLNADVVVLEGNSAINLNANTNMGSGSLFKLASFTASALNAITGSIGQMAAVSDSAGGGNPNGMIAFWDPTNARWSYVHDNSAV